MMSSSLVHLPERFVQNAGLERMPRTARWLKKPCLAFSTSSLVLDRELVRVKSLLKELLYCALIRLLSYYKIVASESELPYTDYVEYNQFKSALVAIPRNFEVELVPREESVCLTEAKERTNNCYADQT